MENTSPKKDTSSGNSDEFTSERKMKLQRPDLQNASNVASKDNRTNKLSDRNCNRKHDFSRLVTPSSTVRNVTQSNLDRYQRAMAPIKRSANEGIIRHANQSKNHDRPHPRCRKSLFAQAESAGINIGDSETKHQISRIHSVSHLNKETKPVEKEEDEKKCGRAEMISPRPLICLPTITRRSSRRHYSSAVCIPSDNSSEMSDDGYLSNEGSDNGDCRVPRNVLDVLDDAEDSEAEYDQPRLLPENYVAPRRQRKLPFRRTATGLCLRARRRLVFDEESDYQKFSLQYRKPLATLHVSPFYIVSDCDKRQVRRRLFDDDIEEQNVDDLTQQLSQCNLSSNIPLASNVSDPAQPSRITDSSRESNLDNRSDSQCSVDNGSVSEFSLNGDSFRQNNDSSSECSNNNDSAFECSHNDDSSSSSSQYNDSSSECSNNNDSAFECSHNDDSSSSSSQYNDSSSECSNNNDSAFECSYIVSSNPCSNDDSFNPCSHGDGSSCHCCTTKSVNSEVTC